MDGRRVPAVDGPAAGLPDLPGVRRAGGRPADAHRPESDSARRRRAGRGRLGGRKNTGVVVFAVDTSLAMAGSDDELRFVAEYRLGDRGGRPLDQEEEEG